MQKKPKQYSGRSFYRLGFRKLPLSVQALEPLVRLPALVTSMELLCSGT